jgi:hypothetical protein
MRPAQPAAAEADVAALLDELAALEGWLASVPEFERDAVPPDLRSIEAGRRKRIQDVRDQLALLAGASQDQARALQFGRQRANLLAHREHIDRLTTLLRANLRGAAAG